MSVRKASDEYGILRSTLHNKVSQKVPLNTLSGVKGLLTNNEETSLVEFLIGCASVGYAKSCNDVLAIAQQIVNAHQTKPNGIIVTSSSNLKNSWGARHP